MAFTALFLGSRGRQTATIAQNNQNHSSSKSLYCLHNFYIGNTLLKQLQGSFYIVPPAANLLYFMLEIQPINP